MDELTLDIWIKTNNPGSQEYSWQKVQKGTWDLVIAFNCHSLCYIVSHTWFLIILINLQGRWGFSLQLDSTNIWALCVLDNFCGYIAGYTRGVSLLPLACSVKLPMVSYLALKYSINNLKSWALKLDLNDSKTKHLFIFLEYLKKAMKNIKRVILVWIPPPQITRRLILKQQTLKHML